jgi:hypothetical protein
METEDAFWLGYFIGLYEGEGTAAAHRRKGGVYGRLVIRMTDREPLELLAEHVGGHLHERPYLSPSEQGKGYKPKHRWTMGTIDGFMNLSHKALPYLSPRRRAQVEKVLEEITPPTRLAVTAGTRRDKRQQQARARKSGELICPVVAEPSARGYQRHRLLGIPVCDICRESFRLYYTERRKWYAEQIKVNNRATYLAHRDERLARQRAYYARKRVERQSQTSDGSASPPSEMAST